MQAIETIRSGRFVAELHYDDSPCNPRTEWDNFGRIWTFESRHYSPDDAPSTDPRAALEHLAAELYGRDFDCDRLDDSRLMAAIERRAVILPVFKYEHGGVAYSTGAFSCPWDSGQCGWTFATRAEILENWSGKRLTPALRKKAAALLAAEVKTYSQWANGEVYGFQIHTAENPADPDDLYHIGDAVDSCWGFYGYSYAMAEMEDAAEACESYAVTTDRESARKSLEKRLERLKHLIRAHVPLDARAAALARL